jgi:hypothetical protein
MRVPADVIVTGAEDSFETKMPSPRFFEGAASERGTARVSVQHLAHSLENVGIVNHHRPRQIDRDHKFREFFLPQVSCAVPAMLCGLVARRDGRLRAPLCIYAKDSLRHRSRSIP